jgi:hypothetical protein
VNGPRVDLTGHKFGRWTVLRVAPRTRSRKRYWIVRCRCGAQRAVRGNRLTTGESRSCGCFLREKAKAPRPWRRRDLRGLRVGQLLVVRLAPHVPCRSRYHPGGKTAWVCHCDCGRDVVVGTAHLTRKRHPAHSCGCANLRPLAPAAPSSQRDAWIATPAPRPINGSATSVARVVPLPTLPALTAQQRLEGWHDSQLGRTRRNCVPVDEDDEVGGVLHDGDPFA